MRHLLSPLDLSVDELARLLDLARDISNDPSKYGHVCDGKKIATLFYEPYYMQSGNNTGTLNTIQSLVNTMLVQGVNFAVLDLVRHQTRVHPFRAVLGLFNGKWFWGSISLWIFTYFLTLIGFSFLVIPGVLLILGWRQAFWVFKDGHEADQRFSSISALIGSWRLMRGFKANLLGLYVSLIGWYLLENLTFHLFDWAINPYLQLVHANYYENRRAYKMAAQA